MRQPAPPVRPSEESQAEPDRAAQPLSDREAPRPRVRRASTLWWLVSFGVLAVVTAVLAVWSPAMQTFLRDSFTELPTAYTELYFVGDPTVVAGPAGPTVSATVTIVRHGTGNAVDEHVLATLAATGEPDRTHTTVVSVSIESPTTVDISQPLPAGTGPVTLTVSLAGTVESVHYKVSPVPTAGKTP